MHWRGLDTSVGCMQYTYGVGCMQYTYGVECMQYTYGVKGRVLGSTHVVYECGV